MKKTKLLATALFAGLVLQQLALSQPEAAGTNQSSAASLSTNSAAYGGMVSNVLKMSTGSNPPSDTVVTTVVTNQTVTTTVRNNSSSTTSVSNPAVASSASNEPASATTASNVTVVPADSNETAAVDNTNMTAAADADTNNPPDGTTDTNQAAAVDQTTRIQFQDIPITSAIENLARQAGINYLMDPKIGYGQPDANGQIKTEPSLSIRWENITPEEALIAVLDNYGLQLVEDPRTKIDKITIKDPLAPPPLSTRVFQLAYASVSNMEGAVSTALTDKRSKVVSDIRTSQLIVVATDKEQTDVESLIQKLDKPTRQVLIETRLIEISSNPSTSKGIDWSGTLQAQNITAGNGAPFVIQPTLPTTSIGPDGNIVTTTPGSPGVLNTVLDTAQPLITANSSTAGAFDPATFFLNADGIKLVMSFLNQSSDAQVVSTPRIVTLDNETATISVTRAFPIFNTTAGTQGSPGGSSITYSNVGIVLEVTPRISANDYIWLKVLPQVSSFYATVTKTVGGLVNQADEFDSREIDTQVLIPNANTLVMGGMVKDSPNANYTKVPILGDIPILGFAFRSETKSIDKQNLLIFITPTILKDTDFQPTASEFLRSRPIKEKEPLDPNSAWDSGKPHDWSNPKNTDPTQIILNQKTTE